MEDPDKTSDTAAALTLAVEIETSERSSETQGKPHDPEKSPVARSLINFWLLSKDHLGPGFSWSDYELVAQSCSAVMLSQNASYIEETCKDLLVLNQATKTVDFLHRTVFDFLTNKKVHAALEEDVPAHFTDSDFIFNLAKLRCICILRDDPYDQNA